MRRRRERGQGLLEYALVLPLLMLFILVLIEFSIVMWSYSTISNAAREGARAAAIYPHDLVAAEAVVRSHTPGLDPNALGVETAWLNYRVYITTTYTVTLMTAPVINTVGGSSDVHLGTVAVMRCE
jgi:Flp pilus assembly protein TadG